VVRREIDFSDDRQARQCHRVQVGQIINTAPMTAPPTSGWSGRVGPLDGLDGLVWSAAAEIKRLITQTQRCITQRDNI